MACNRANCNCDAERLDNERDLAELYELNPSLYDDVRCRIDRALRTARGEEPGRSTWNDMPALRRGGAA
jgi:hypothetical protein